MADPNTPTIHSPQYWQDARALSDAELEPFRTVDLAELTPEQRTQYELALAHQIARLFTVIEAIALALPEPKPTPVRKPRNPRSPRAPKIPPRKSRTVEVHDV